MKIHKSNLSDFLIKMNFKGEQEAPRTPKHVSIVLSTDPADALLPENSSKQGSPVTTDSPVQVELFQTSQEQFHLSEASSILRSADIFEARPTSGFEAVGRNESLISSFVKTANVKKDAENGSITSKDTDRAALGKSAFKSPLPSSPSRQASAFQFVKSNEGGIAYLRSKICQACQPTQPPTPQDRPRIIAPVPALRPLNKFPRPQDCKGLSALSSFSVRSETQPSAYSVIKISSLKMRNKRAEPENGPEADSEDNFVVEDCKEGEVFRCKHCGKCFTTGQALGGHMSRKHSGKSSKYNYKKDVRKRREFERMKLYMAKKKYFESLGCDYEQMVQTPDGKMKAKTLINRSRIKKIKSILTDEEVYNYFESQQ